MRGEYFAYTDGIKKSGHYLGGNALQPTATATTVRVRNGRTATTDGPFAETKEQLAGYYLVEAKDLNDAIQVGARIPGARFGSIEVRPIMEIPGAWAATRLKGGATSWTGSTAPTRAASSRRSSASSAISISPRRRST